MKIHRIHGKAPQKQGFQVVWVQGAAQTVRKESPGNHRLIAEASNVGGVWGCPKYLSKLRYQYYRTGRTGGL